MDTESGQYKIRVMRKDSAEICTIMYKGPVSSANLGDYRIGFCSVLILPGSGALVPPV